MATTDTLQSIQIYKPAAPAIVAELAPVVAEALAFQVTNIETCAMALERVKALRAGEKKIEEAFEPSRKAADLAKKEILALRDALIGPIAAARGVYDRTAAVYEQAEREKAAAEERRLQELAKEEEEDRQLEAAQEAQDRGDTEEAESIASETVYAPVIRVQPAIPKVEGVSNRTTWGAQVHDPVCRIRDCAKPECYEPGLIALVKHVAAHPEWIRFLEPAMKILNSQAVALHENLRIPGVRAVSTTGRATR